MNALQFESLLVPVDFSPASESAFEHAMELTRGENAVVILLHVIDPSLVSFATSHEWGTAEEVTKHMRERAQTKLEGHRQRAVGQEVDIVICEGTPFLEILKKAEDFAVDAIVIGKVGARGMIEKLLFGSTAEKVIRGSRLPVIVLPANN